MGQPQPGNALQQKEDQGPYTHCLNGFHDGKPKTTIVIFGRPMSVLEFPDSKRPRPVSTLMRINWGARFLGVRRNRE